MATKKRPSKKGTVQMPATVAALKREMQESDDLRDRMSLILRNTADALHGGPLENGYWSWHDLPELAQAKLDEANQLQDKLRISEDSRLALLLYIRTNPDPVLAQLGTAYADMVETCRKVGLTPLSPEQFAREDARLITDWNRRRHGVDPGHVNPRGLSTNMSDGCWPDKPDLIYVNKKSAWTRFWHGFRPGFMHPFRGGWK